MLDPNPELPDDTLIDQLNFSTRIRRALHFAGFKTVGDIRESTDATLLSLPDIGDGSVAFLRTTLGHRSNDGVRVVGPKQK